MDRGKPRAAAIPMSERHYRLLLSERAKRTALRQYSDRIDILLRCTVFEGNQSNGQIHRELGISYNTVKTWRERWRLSYPTLVSYELSKDGNGVSDNALVAKMLSFLDDLPRMGAPKRITLEQEQQLVALACQKPEDFDIPITTWTHKMLAQVAVSQGIMPSISSRYVGAILKKAALTTA